MKKFSTLFVCVGAVLALAIGWSVSRLRASTLASAPARIHISASEWDFGTVSGEKAVSHVFNVQNISGQPLAITKLEKSCGCVKAAQLGDSVIPAQGTMPLRTTIEVTPNEQDIYETVKLYGSSNTEPIATVQIKGRVRPIVNIVPPIVNFGILTQDDLKQKQQLTISKGGAESAKDHLDVKLPNNKWHSDISRQDAKQWKVSFGLSPDTPIGPLDNSIEIKPMWGKTRKVAVLGELLGPVAATPKEFYQSLSESHKGNVVIKFGGDERVASVRVLSLTPMVKPWITPQVRGKDTIVFHYDVKSSKLAQPLSGRCLVEVSGASSKKYKVAVPITFSN